MPASQAWQTGSRNRCTSNFPQTCGGSRRRVWRCPGSTTSHGSCAGPVLSFQQWVQITGIVIMDSRFKMNTVNLGLTNCWFIEEVPPSSEVANARIGKPCQQKALAAMETKPSISVSSGILDKHTTITSGQSTMTFKVLIQQGHRMPKGRSEPL